MSAETEQQKLKIAIKLRCPFVAHAHPDILCAVC